MIITTLDQLEAVREIERNTYEGVRRASAEWDCGEWIEIWEHYRVETQPGTARVVYSHMIDETETRHE